MDALITVCCEHGEYVGKLSDFPGEQFPVNVTSPKFARPQHFCVLTVGVVELCSKAYPTCAELAAHPQLSRNIVLGMLVNSSEVAQHHHEAPSSDAGMTPPVSGSGGGGRSRPHHMLCRDAQLTRTHSSHSSPSARDSFWLCVFQGGLSLEANN